MRIPLEDNFEDVLSKAASGLGFDAGALAARTGMEEARIKEVLGGKFDSGVVARLAEILDLNGPSLFELATKAWVPDPVKLDGLAAFNTPFPVPGYEEMTVNSYLVWDPETRYAAAFDTGSDVGEMLDLIEEKSLRLGMVCLTHTHSDHIQALDRLMKETGQPQLYVNELEAIKGAQAFQAGTSLSIGHLQVQTRLTRGHSPGGTTYIVSGLGKPLALVGDALFCCSMGGAGSHYEEARELIRKNILSLPEETILCPGHGPMSTVGQEWQHNACFAVREQ
mgnify:CR=1 FL=1